MADKPDMGGGANEDLYSADADPQDKTDDSKPAEGKEDEQSDVEESVAPTSMFGGRDLEVGQQETIEITGVHGDQVSFKCVYGEDKGEGEGEASGGKAEMPAGMGGGSDSMYD